MEYILRKNRLIKEHQAKALSLTFFFFKQKTLVSSFLSHPEWPLTYPKNINVTALHTGHRPIQESSTLADSALFLLGCAVISTEIPVWCWAEKAPVKYLT